MACEDTGAFDSLLMSKIPRAYTWWREQVCVNLLAFCMLMLLQGMRMNVHWHMVISTAAVLWRSIRLAWCHQQSVHAATEKLKLVLSVQIPAVYGSWSGPHSCPLPHYYGLWQWFAGLSQRFGGAGWLLAEVCCNKEVMSSGVKLFW